MEFGLRFGDISSHVKNYYLLYSRKFVFLHFLLNVFVSRAEEVITRRENVNVVIIQDELFAI